MSYPTTKKSDDWDAYCVASVLLRILDKLPDANPQDLYWTIKMMVNRRDAIVKALTILTNQLHGQICYHYPSYKKFFNDVNCKTALVFWEKYPSPRHIKGVTAIALVAGIRDIKRFRNADKLARFAGIAPVNFSSAGKGKDKKSKQGNREPYAVFYFLAVQQIQVVKGNDLPRNPVFLEYYKRKISKGKTKIQALVCVMRRLVNIIFEMMKNKSEYIMPVIPLKEAV